MPAVSVEQVYELGLQHHRAGRLADAETFYRQVLAARPDHAGALHHLGLIAHQAGRHELAVEWIRRAISLDPENSSAYANLGEACRAAGLYDEAVSACRRAIELNPSNASAHSNLGGAYRALGLPEEALACYRRAIELQPDFAQAQYNLGVLLAETGNLDAAADAYRRALDLKPDHAEACYNLGIILSMQQHFDAAVRAFRRTLELAPSFPAAHNHLGMALAGQRQWDQAIASYQRAIQLQPEFAEALNNLGIALRFRGEFDEALATYRRALQIRPDFPEAYNNLGEALAQMARLDEAITALGEALKLEPDYVRAHQNLGNVFTDAGQFDAAVRSYRRAIELEPESAETQKNLGHALRYQRQFDAADVAYRRALELQPDFAEARFGQAQQRLLLGDFAHGWPLYESRWDAFRSEQRTFPQPTWNGEPFPHQRLLIHAEQGFGDAIQFVRYASLAAERGGEVLVECPRTLAGLFHSVEGVREVIAAGDPLPPFDLHLPMLSLPLVFRTTPEAVPQKVPYLQADPERIDQWRVRLGGRQRSWRVGLAWQGNRKTILLRKRDVTLRSLLPLWDVKGVEFVSLQIGPGAQQIQELPGGSEIIDPTPNIHDFADTAALMTNLDLMISVDTSVAHLAGALGRPVWTLISFVPDWRWGLESEDTLWYPTMRLFRQPVPDDWDSVIQRVAGQLEQAIHAGRL
jgi:tetratricopeptide (TPR) repeat protein